MSEVSNLSKDDLLRLAQKVRRGDHCAFERLYKHFYASLCEFVLRYVQNKEIAEDIVQSLFLDIYEKGADWNPTDNVKTYIFTSARNKALNYLRDNEEHLSTQWTGNAHISPPLNYNPVEEEQYFKDLQRALQDAYKCMPEKRRLVFLLSRESNLSYKEISKVLNISVKTVETHMGRALKALRDELKHFFNLIRN